MKWLLILFFIGIYKAAYVQQEKDVDCFFVTDTVMTAFGKTFSNKLMVINHTTRTVTLFKNPETEDHALISVPDTLKLPAGSTQVFPVKYLPSAMQRYCVSFKATDLVSLPDSAVFYVRMNEPDHVRINVLEPNLYLDPQIGRISFRLRCLNDGYLPVKIVLTLNSYPEGLEFEKRNETMELAAGAQQIVTLNARNLLSKGYAPDFMVNLQATDPSGKTLATTSIKITSLSSTKRLATGYNQYSNLLNNSVELNYMNLNRDFIFYQLRGKGNISSSDKSNIAYNLNLNYYAKQQTMDAYDTWVGYSNKHFGIKLGNIAENLDYSLYGRGVKASVFLNEKSGFDAYYVNNNYLLFSGNQSLNTNANTYAADYYNGKPGEKNVRVAVIHTDDPYARLKTNLINGETTVISTNLQTLNFSAGYSYETSSDSSISKSGYAIGGIYTIQKDKWNLNLNNYFSSNYYSGLRRGVVQMEERLRYAIDSLTGAYIRYSKLQNNPDYLSQTWLIPDNNNQTMVYEIGFSRKINAFSFTFYPYLMCQDLNDQFFTGKELHSFSTRAALDLNYSFGNSMLSLNGDYGYTKSKKYYHSLKIDANFSATYWGINARIQTNPYDLQEELMTAGQGEFRQYSFGPNLHANVLKQRMELSVSTYTNYNNYGFGWNNTVDAQARYKMGNTWQLSGQVFYNTYSNLKNSGNTQLRIGVQKSFASGNAPGLKKLAVIFFGDANSNGIRDDGEQLLEGIIVDLSGTVAISNQKGKVIYANLTRGEKIVQVRDGKGWSQLEPLTLALLSNQEIKIPLVKSGRLIGQIVPVAQMYVTEEPMLEGIRVIAIDNFQHTFSALSDENGNFYFSVPVGRYTVHIETTGQSFSIKDAHKIIDISEKANEPVMFEWLDERRKTEVKRF